MIKICPTPYKPLLCISRARGNRCLLQDPGCEPCDLEGNLSRGDIEDIIREDRAERIRADKENEDSIIDADQMNLELRRGKVLQTFQRGKTVIREEAL
jgi:hypothetical protein